MNKHLKSRLWRGGTGLMIGLSCLLSAPACRADFLYNVFIDFRDPPSQPGTGLQARDDAGSSATNPGPYYINFFLSDGIGSADNGAFFSNFMFNGTGGPVGLPTTMNGAAGTLGTSVTLTDAVTGIPPFDAPPPLFTPTPPGDSLNDFYQQFDVPGTFSFDVRITDNINAGPSIPDVVGFSILNGFSPGPPPGPADIIPTTDQFGYNTFVNFYIDGTPGPGVANPGDFYTHPDRVNDSDFVSSATDIVIPAPTVRFLGQVPAGPAAVPEPSTWAMMIIGLAGVAFTERRRRKAALVPARYNA